MTTQAAMIMDTILGMKRTIAQQDDSSDSDDPYLQPPNRGNKLKRKALHLHSEHLKHKRGRPTYTKTIEHAGHKRDILRYNPKRVDEDGDELDSEDEDDEADLRAAEENPYADVKLENILCPLTSAANLPQHPSLSVPYISSTLSDMAQHACETVQRERKTLESARLLLLKFRGDETWIPTEQLNAPDDDEIFGTEHVYQAIVSNPTMNGTRNTNDKERPNGKAHDVPISLLDSALRNDRHRRDVNGKSTEVVKEIQSQEAAVDGSDSMRSDKASEILQHDLGAQNAESGLGKGTTIAHNINEQPDLEGEPDQRRTGDPADISEEKGEKGHIVKDVHASAEDVAEPAEREDADAQGAIQKAQNGLHVQEPRDGDGNDGSDGQDGVTGNGEDSGDMQVDGDENRPAPRRMRTRAQAQAISEPIVSPHGPPIDSPYVPPPIHPLFLLPPSAKPDPNYGLSIAEAEETRRMLMVYVQKQEEICRSAEQLYEGLLKADRQRQTVFKWCKAEGHVGEMSDGEDWYDKEEWGLDDNLRKGEADERVADDDVGAQGKKTRGRRG